jgi:hypothetical protein
MTSIPSKTDSRYLTKEPYEGWLHPIDGSVQKFGLTVPFGYGLWLMGAVPSWLMMLVVSFASRQIMNRRMGDGMGGGLGAGPRPAAGGAAPPPAAAPKAASPAGKAGKKKR